MSSLPSLRRWTSATQSSQHGVELLPVEPESDLASALTEVARTVVDASFLLVPIDTVESVCIHRAVQAYHLAGGAPRLCLVGQRRSLEAIEIEGIDFDRTGLLLDAVDDRTPLCDFVWDRIEGLRFSSDFVSRSALQMRVGCVLESMLGLSRELGLCTLGSLGLPDGASVAGRADFDYLPSPATDSASRWMARSERSVGRGQEAISAR